MKTTATTTTTQMEILMVKDNKNRPPRLLNVFWNQTYANRIWHLFKPVTSLHSIYSSLPLEKTVTHLDNAKRNHAHRYSTKLSDPCYSKPPHLLPPWRRPLHPSWLHPLPSPFVFLYSRIQPLAKPFGNNRTRTNRKQPYRSRSTNAEHSNIHSRNICQFPLGLL